MLCYFLPEGLGLEVTGTTGDRGVAHRSGKLSRDVLGGMSGSWVPLLVPDVSAVPQPGGTTVPSPLLPLVLPLFHHFLIISHVQALRASVAARLITSGRCWSNAAQLPHCLTVTRIIGEHLSDLDLIHSSCNGESRGALAG